MMDRAGVDHQTLLCERCGYVLEGLDPEGACPECGTPIARSLPHARPGSRWQREGVPMAVAPTLWAFLRRPLSAWDTVRVERRWSVRLFLVCMTLALLGMAPGLRALESLLRAGLPLEPWLWLLPVALVTPPGVWALTWVERRGVMFFGARRGWRVTPTVAWTVCGHASVGWVLAGLLVTAGLYAARLAALGRPAGPALLARDIVIAWAPLAGFFAGMLVFETLVYLGVRRLRFANEAGVARGSCGVEGTAGRA